MAESSLPAFPLEESIRFTFYFQIIVRMSIFLLCHKLLIILLSILVKDHESMAKIEQLQNTHQMFWCNSLSHKKHICWKF